MRIIGIIADRETAVVLLDSAHGRTANNFFRIIVLILPKRFDFFLFLAVVFLVLFSMRSGVITRLVSLLINNFLHFFILQIQKHQFIYNEVNLNYLLLS